MKSIEVNASKSYNIKIGSGLLDCTGAEAKSVIGVCKALVITDTNVEKLYFERLKASLENTGFQVIKYVIKAGEASKNTDNFVNILNFAAENSLSRTDAIFALGGGVVGDLSGFCAAAFLRGIKFIQIPTTLLASVDSSVGGKTAVNLDAGKNLAGAFYQPDLVICDIDLQKTLPPEIFADGCAEVIKTAVLGSKKLFEQLKNKVIDEDVIAQCVEIKSRVVNEDEFDRGTRQLLNLGHTAGHAIEKLSDFKISHGSAVAMGMALIASAGLTDETCKNEIIDMLKLYSLPVKCPYNAEEIFKLTLSDKKIADSKISLVIPLEIGNCILKKCNKEELRNLIQKGVNSL